MTSLKAIAQAQQRTLALMKQANARHQRLTQEHEELLDLHRECQDYILAQQGIGNIIKEQRGLYSDAMYAKLQIAVRDSINKVLPTRQYQVEMTPDVYRGKNILRLNFIDEDGFVIPPKTVEGDMLNQVLSFATIALVSFRSGFPVVFYDEAFPSANSRSILLIRELIKDLVEMGMQFIFVTQNPLLLASIDRHVIELVAMNNSVSTVLEYDVSGADYDSANDERIINALDSLTKGDDIREL